MDYWAKLDRYPPVLIRLLARSSDGKALSDATLSVRGTTLAEVKWLSHLTSWDSVPVSVARRFLDACGADLGSRDWVRRTNRYVNPNSEARFTHLTRSPEWPYFQGLITIYLKHIIK